jgi:hypothetical protein
MRSSGFGIIIIFAVITYAALSLNILKSKLESRLPLGVLYAVLLLILIGLTYAYVLTINAYSGHRKWDDKMPWVGSGLGIISWLILGKIRNNIEKW